MTATRNTRSLWLSLCAVIAAIWLPLNLPAAPAANVFEPDTIRGLMRQAADYQFALDDAERKPDPNWIRATFYTGVMSTYYATGDRKYFERALRYAREEGGWTIHSASGTGPGRGRRHADLHTIGQTYAELFFFERDPVMIRDFRAAVDEMLAQPHPGRLDWWWCDSVYMAPPAWARLYVATGERKYLEFMDELFADMQAHLYDPAECLFFRDQNYFEKRAANGQKIFWSRGNGWVVAGLARMLDYLPQTHPTRPRYIALFREMCVRIAGLQNRDGLWRANLLDPLDPPGPESSGSGFFVFAMAWGLNQGLLDRATFEPVVRKGWTALTGCLTPEGRFGYVQPVGKDPKTALPDGTYPFGVGAFLNAGLELIKLNGGAPLVAPPAANPPPTPLEKVARD